MRSTGPVSWVHQHLASRGAATPWRSCPLCSACSSASATVIYEPFLHQSKVFQQGLPPLMNRVKQLPLIGPWLRHVDLVGRRKRFLQQIPKWSPATRT